MEAENSFVLHIISEPLEEENRGVWMLLLNNCSYQMSHKQVNQTLHGPFIGHILLLSFYQIIGLEVLHILYQTAYSYPSIFIYHSDANIDNPLLPFHPDWHSMCGLQTDPEWLFFIYILRVLLSNKTSPEPSEEATSLALPCKSWLSQPRFELVADKQFSLSSCSQRKQYQWTQPKLYLFSIK